MLYRATETRVVFPVTSLTILALVITAAGLAATGLTLPWLFRSGDPDLLHAD